MSTIKISELNSISSLTNSDVLPIVNEAETKKVSISQLQDIFASKEYVNESIKNIPDNTYIINTSTSNEEKITIMQEVYDKYTSGVLAQLFYVDTSGNVFRLFDVDKFDSTIDFYVINGGSASTQYGVGYYAYDRYKISCGYSESVITSVTISELSDIYVLADNAQILGINNQTEFTPQVDYQPSTKKYVDDSIKSAIGDVLESEY